jgi:predicted RNA-binding Zn ribbon-like protein
MSADEFDVDAGELCLNFANTLDYHASENPVERLNHFGDLIRWGEASCLLQGDRAGHLRLLAEQEPGDAAAVLERAILLREVIYRIFSALSKSEGAAPEDLEFLNEFLGESLAHLVVILSSGEFSWGWRESPDSLAQVIWPVARSAGELLISDKLSRVRECADERGCGYLFVDMSRNRSRRWCSMEACGNRAKAQRHYQRQKEDLETE